MLHIKGLFVMMNLPFSFFVEHATALSKCPSAEAHFVYAFRRKVNTKCYTSFALSFDLMIILYFSQMLPSAI
jgi:hypothetical protein